MSENNIQMAKSESDLLLNIETEELRNQLADNGIRHWTPRVFRGHQ